MALGAVVGDSAQIEVVNAILSPEVEELERAREMVFTFESKGRIHSPVLAAVCEVVCRPAYWEARAAFGPLEEKP